MGGPRGPHQGRCPAPRSPGLAIRPSRLPPRAVQSLGEWRQRRTSWPRASRRALAPRGVRPSEHVRPVSRPSRSGPGDGIGGGALASGRGCPVRGADCRSVSRLCVCVCAHVGVQEHALVYVCRYMCSCVHVGVHTQVCAHPCAQVGVHRCMCTMCRCVCIHLCVPVCVHACAFVLHVCAGSCACVRVRV